jgi:Ca2+-binding EF-hand superfamily protein
LFVCFGVGGGGDCCQVLGLYLARTCCKPGFKRIFDFFDSDGSGSIDRGELARTIKRMTGESATAEVSLK